jgi:dihydroneopterin aldolase
MSRADGQRKDQICSFILRAEIEIKCGMHKWEQHPERPTRLLVTVKMFADLADGPTSGQRFIDYDALRTYLKSLEHGDHIAKLETIADGIAATCFADKQVEACSIQIEKPDIFNEAEAAGIEVFRTRRSWEATG